MFVSISGIAIKMAIILNSTCPVGWVRRIMSDIHFSGEYKRLVSNLLSKAEKDKIRRKEYENEHENDENSLSSSVVPLNATNNNEKKDLNNDENKPNLTQLEALEIKNEQIKRLIELQTMAAQIGDIPGTYVL